MDTSELIIEYSAADFTLALRQLLPQGHYWQDADNMELSALIAGMGADFKMTHDEIQLALLTENDSNLFGWRLADYQTLMADYAIVGKVNDSSSTPNIISIYLDPSQPYKKMMAGFDAVRLPHTQFHWVLNALESVDDLVVRVGGYQKHIYHMRIGPKASQNVVNSFANTAPYVTTFETYEITINE
ncbi:hypothetical protein [Moritella sp. F3]|uniref:hypothetical protein n=1 Tax=Moritella sp. F3 TaxID=2718882 RepID=UPI0018E13D3C|nr:hypothetical protein [Moritella sp. F3]GIC79488.1 hypothetical protein FMO001_42150 [Moritella sp. F1]GIC79766.1 hypothetical protein FMO003_00470 [Moritella sp. F3]